MSQHQAPGPQEDWGSATPWNQPTAPWNQPTAPRPTQPRAPYRPANLHTYMIPAVLATLFFLPTGIAALVYASQVTAKLNAGDVQGAEKASANARTWVIVTAVAAVVFLGIVMINVIAALSSTPNPYGA
jgi:Interferon-induced transmembrane protein